MALRPRLLGAGKAAPVSEEKLGEPMPRPQQIRPNVFPTTQQIAGRLFLRGRNVNRRQRAGPIQHRELARIPPIRFDAIARAARNEGRRDHVARHLVRHERPLQFKAAGPGFIAAHDRSLPPHALDESQNGQHVGREGVDGRRPLPRQQDGGHRRGSVLIERDDDRRLQHDRPPLYAALR
jgi:hypothetical protein